MPLANAIGIYLLAGTVLMGLGLMTRAGWKASGKLKEAPQGKYGKQLFVIGVILGTLLWPIFIFAMPFMWWLRGKVKGIERHIEYCVHSTPFEPICGPCSRELQKTSAITKRRVGGDEVEKAARRHLAEIAAKVNAELGEPHSFYECWSCKVMFEGFPPAATSEGRPLCGSCSSKP